MGKVEVNLEFDIKDIVSHTVTKQNGIIVDWRMSANSKIPSYLVVYGHNNEDSVWCSEFELDKVDSSKIRKVGFKK